MVAGGPAGLDRGDPYATGVVFPAVGNPAGEGRTGPNDTQDPDDTPDEEPPVEDGLLAGSLALQGDPSSVPVGACDVLGPGSDRRRRVFRPPA